uniref:Uncharacterized protein n=1 Tax=Alexandrium andersonii TaxID=327968 RepID=A0A7S2C2F5_9DINO|mmetsp:Transcript_32653/g.74340  ORF Transcript_32653/g.74340 Transcript_32653/m.74340 type:complete len:112 (-) Transcript_32653:54-389(-)
MSSTLYGKNLDHIRQVTVDIGGGRQEVVDLDPEHGPMRATPDGGMTFINRGRMNVFYNLKDTTNMGEQYKSWRQHTSTEQEVMVIQVAKMNAALRSRMEADAARAATEAVQ